VSHGSSTDTLPIVVVAEDRVTYADSLNRPTVNQSAGRKAFVYKDQSTILYGTVVHWPVAQCLHRGDLHPAPRLRADASLDDTEVYAALLESSGRLLQQFDAVS